MSKCQICDRCGKHSTQEPDEETRRHWGEAYVVTTAGELKGLHVRRDLCVECSKVIERALAYTSR